MKERPILFSAPMVRAILAGDKTQTRRVVKPQPKFSERWNEWQWPSKLAQSMVEVHEMASLGPYGSRGDRLWVRETWSLMNRERTEAWSRKIENRPTGSEVVYRADEDHGHKAWRPSIFMPRWASRIDLEITSVRVETLHAISSREAVAEGVVDDSHGWDGNPTYPLARFKSLWSEINGAESWAANPWVWVVEFKRVGGAA